MYIVKLAWDYYLAYHVVDATSEQANSLEAGEEI